MTREKESAGSAAFGCLLALVAVAIAIPMEGWAIAKLWAWFAVPVFGVAPLSIWYAAGLALLLRAMRPAKVMDSQDKGMVEMGGRMIGNAIFYPLICVGLGWIIVTWGGLP